MTTLLINLLRRLTPALLLAMLVGNSFAESQTYKRTVEAYSIPDVTLVNQEGKQIGLKSLLESERPVVVDFIFGTSTIIGPVLSAGYSNLQKRLGADVGKVHLVSISIDPENDTPKVMKEYLMQYRARPGWDFFTGSRKDIEAVMRAFDAYIPNKTAHYPLTLIRVPSEAKWVRLYGIMSSAEFIAELQKVGVR